MSDRADFESILPPENESFYDWGKNNPNSEYALWLMTRDREKLRQQANSRLRVAEWGPRVVKMQALGGVALGLGFNYGTYTSVSEGKYGQAAAFGLLSLIPFSAARSQIRDELPKVVEDLYRERMYHKKALKVAESLEIPE